MKKIINYAMIIDGGGGKLHGQTKYGDNMDKSNNPFGYSCAVGNNNTHAYGCAVTIPQARVHDVSYVNDIDVYKRHLYRLDLKNKGLKGIGINSFGLKPFVNRDDMKICNEIVNNFKNKKMTKFEKRLHAALKRKEDIEQIKQSLLGRIKLNYDDVKNKYDFQIEKLKKTTKKNKDLDDTNFTGSTGNYFNKTPKVPLVEQLLPKKELSDKDIIYLFINKHIDWHGVNHYNFEEKGIKYIDFVFVQPIDENDKRLDILVELKGKVLSYEEKSSNELIREIENDSNVIISSIAQVFGKFTKKKTYIKKIRVEFNNLLEMAKTK